jgi:Ankyrin repeats (many copies)
MVIHLSSNYCLLILVLLADPRVDKSSVNHTNICGHTALWHATWHGHFPVVKLLITNCRTSWDSIVELTDVRRAMQNDDISPLLIAELTRRQICAIYPSANRVLWPVSAQSDAESGDAECSGPAADDDSREESDGMIGEPVRECAFNLITSFFQSRVFDVNVLRIIREYATYTV